MRPKLSKNMLSNRPSAEAAHNNNTASPSPHRVGSAAPKSDDASITRISRACERCRRRKIRCNGAQPCTGCSRQPTACDYRTGHSRVRTRRNQQPSASARNGPRDPSPDHPAPISTSEQPAPKPKVPGRSWYNRCCVGIRISNHLTSTFQVYGKLHRQRPIPTVTLPGFQYYGCRIAMVLISC